VTVERCWPLRTVLRQWCDDGVLYRAGAPDPRPDRRDVGQFGLLLTSASLFGLLGKLAAGRIIHAATTKRVLQIGAVVMVLSLVVIARHAARGMADRDVGLPVRRRRRGHLDEPAGLVDQCPPPRAGE